MEQNGSVLDESGNIGERRELFMEAGDLLTAKCTFIKA